MQDLKKLHKEMRLCEEIERRSVLMEQKLQEIESEEKENESRRGHSRSDGQDDPGRH